MHHDQWVWWLIDQRPMSFGGIGWRPMGGGGGVGQWPMDFGEEGIGRWVGENTSFSFIIVLLY